MTPRKGGDQGDSARNLGKSPDSRVCLRCGRVVGGFYLFTGWHQAKHKNAAGRWCRIERKAGTGEIVAPRAITETKG